ncbi:unnamed protein product, partial [Didymodactylos carnosus]
MSYDNYYYILTFIILTVIFIYSNLFDFLLLYFNHRLDHFKKNRRPYRIILVRHGESQGNLDTSIYARLPDPQVSLTDTGVEQAYNVGKQLKEIIKDGTVYVYLSPYTRSKRTYEAIS